MDSTFDSVLAGLSGWNSTEEYHAQHQEAIRALPMLKVAANALKVETIDDYRSGKELFGILNSLICYVWNHKMKDIESNVAEVYNIAWKKLYVFCKSYNALRGDYLKIAKYMCWSRHYYHSKETATKLAFMLQGHIYKTERGTYVVVGMHLATGDNTFSVSWNGKMYRNYIKELGLQAIGVNSYWQEYFAKLEEDGMEFATLPSDYEVVGVGNYKHGVKISFSRSDRVFICNQVM